MDSIRLLTRLLSIILSALLFWTPFYSQSKDSAVIDKASQEERISELEKQYVDNIPERINECDFLHGDYESILNGSIKFNQLSFIGTHNSYQKASVKSVQKIHKAINKLSSMAGMGNIKILLDNKTITEQLNLGIRSLEIDIEAVYNDGKYSFNCFHTPMLDMTTSCYDLELALKEIKMWSDYNKNHLPITIIIEPKKAFAPMKNMEFFSLTSALALDDTIRNALGDTLLTPANMLEGYASFKELRENDGWKAVSDTLGKVLVLLHDTTVTKDYINIDKSIKTQAMFPMLRSDDFDKNYASFIIINDIEKEGRKIEEANDKNLIVRTRAELNGNVNESKKNIAESCNAGIISTDFPYYNMHENGYFVSFNQSNTVKIVK